MNRWQQFQQELENVSGEAQRVALARFPDVWSRWRSREGIQQIACFATRVPEEPVAQALALLSHQQSEGFSAASVSPETVKEHIAALDLAVVYAHYLIAETGTAFLLDAHHRARGLYLLPPHLLVLSSPRRLQTTLAGALAELSREEEPARSSGFLLVTGPSRTADIEKKLVIGVHGPERLTVWLLED